MISRKDWPIIVGALVLYLGPFLVLLGVFWLGAGKELDSAFAEFLELAETQAMESSSKQLLAGILLFQFIVVVTGGFLLWLMLWMIGVILLLILRELREAKRSPPLRNG